MIKVDTRDSDEGHTHAWSVGWERPLGAPAERLIDRAPIDEWRFRGHTMERASLRRGTNSLAAI